MIIGKNHKDITPIWWCNGKFKSST